MNAKEQILPACKCEGEVTSAPHTDPNPQPIYLVLVKGLGILILWLAIYWYLQPFADWLTYTLLRFPADSHLGSAISFFVYEVPKILMLLSLIVFVVGIIRTFFTPERTRQILAGHRETYGNILAAGLGIVTPFCSCSAIPLFIGFLKAGVPLGVTFSFLISSPMINEVAVILLFGMFGWKVAMLYIGTGLVIAILAGWTIGRLKMEKYVEPWVYNMPGGKKNLTEDRKTEERKNGITNDSDEKPISGSEAGALDIPETESISWSVRILAGKQAMLEIVGKVWPFLLIGIAVGAGIHGYVPEGFMAKLMGKHIWWSVPVAVLIGIPSYSNAAGIIPIVHSLLEKGAALGTTLAFMMAVIAISLPEMIILRKVLKLRMLLVFIGIITIGIILVGYLFNLIL
ncbi:MAG: permease [bacterium]